MQYQPLMTREALKELAIGQYFANVDKKNMDAVLSCFHDSSLFTIQTAFTVHDGKSAIKRMFTDFFDAYETIIHKDFTCTVDEKQGRIAAVFTAELVDKQGQITLLENTNFWRVRDGKFQEVYVYMNDRNPLV